ncbi:hypothetical protein MC7420_8145 [Coleofasciculus chthonoplastes PCC 7420]|uniref:Uncharacterized protein n=1 Tax=Coleofasciculus chthonoplastes PCC 7420 TaxID=118168 RepID=B4W508_9CYAN|nr:hypothetical protein MC7420_8145 [Coleofasciculus chthonoplastes PCC 7420]
MGRKYNWLITGVISFGIVCATQHPALIRVIWVTYESGRVLLLSYG